MHIPILDLDMSWLVQIVVFLAYIAMVYFLVKEIITDKPFRPPTTQKKPAVEYLVKEIHGKKAQ